MTHANVSLLTALLMMSVVFMLGYARAVMVRANRDYKATKAAVKPLRRAFWSSLGAVMKFGFAVVLVLTGLVFCNVRETDDVRDAGEKAPLVPASTSPSARPSGTR